MDRKIGVVLSVVICVLIGVSFLGIWINQCIVGAGDSLHVQTDTIHLMSRPTDNVFLGWEWLWGKPTDEISLKLYSGICAATNHPKKIEEGQKLNFDASINTFFGSGFAFQLEEFDSGFEGANDYSETIEVSADKLDKIREAFDNGIMNYVELDYTVTVKGANIFQENRWFGFLAENLCVSALDFVFGPWTSKVFAKAIIFKSGDMAKLYNTVRKQYESKTITKASVFKSVLTYQLKSGAKMAVKKPLQRNMAELAREWALNQTLLDEAVEETVTSLKESAVFAVSGKEGLDLYREVNAELDELANYLGRLTDKLEFCLSEVLPPSKDALYHVALTVTR